MSTYTVSFNSANVSSDGLSLTINLNTPVPIANNNLNANLYVSSDYNSLTITNVVLNDDNISITLTLSSAIQANSNVIVTYCGTNIKNTNGVNLLSFIHQPAINNSTVTPVTQTSYFLAGATNIIGDFNDAYAQLSSLVSLLQSVVAELTSDEVNYIVQMYGGKIRHLRQRSIDMINDAGIVSGNLSTISNQGNPPNGSNPGGQNNGW